MCIAAVIFEPVSLEYLEAMDSDNPHGAGVAWQSGDSIQFRRGLDAKGVYALQQEGQMTYPYLLHFRWATHGDRVPELTHPFPTGVRALMGELSGSASEVVIHNGTWGDYLTEGRKHIPHEMRSMLTDMSDTAVAAFIVAYNPDILDDVPWATAHAFMRNGTMDITTRGTWTEYEKNWYSNLNWVPSNKTSGWERIYKFEKHDWGGSRTKSYSNPYRMRAPGPSAPAESTAESSWDAYIRAKYGDAAAEELNKMMTAENTDDTVAECEMVMNDERFLEVQRVDAPLKEEVDWSDIISEDGSVVNKFLGSPLREGLAGAA